MTLLAAAAASALLLTGCANPDTASESTAAAQDTALPAAEANAAAIAALPAELRERGTLVVTMSQSSPPLHFVEGDKNTTIGVDPEIAVAIGQALGLETTVESGPFDTIIPGIAAGKFDLSISQMTPSVERLEVLDFVDYYQSGSGVGVTPGNPLGLDADALCGVRVGVLKGSFQDVKRVPEASEACVAAGEQPLVANTYPDMQAPNLALAAGRIDAVWVDGPTLEYAAQQTGEIEVLGRTHVSPVSIGFAKGRGLETSLMLALESLSDSGLYQQILDKWGVGAGAITDFGFNQAQ